MKYIDVVVDSNALIYSYISLIGNFRYSSFTKYFMSFNTV